MCNPHLFVWGHRLPQISFFPPSLNSQMSLSSEGLAGISILGSWRYRHSPDTRQLASGSQVIAPLPIHLAQVPDSSLWRTWPRPAIPKDDGIRRHSQPRLSHARAGSTTSGLVPGLSHVWQNSSHSSFPPAWGIAIAALATGAWRQEPFLPWGRFICLFCNATVLHASSCEVTDFLYSFSQLLSFGGVV